MGISLVNYLILELNPLSRAFLKEIISFLRTEKQPPLRLSKFKRVQKDIIEEYISGIGIDYISGVKVQQTLSSYHIRFLRQWIKKNTHKDLAGNVSCSFFPYMSSIIYHRSVIIEALQSIYRTVQQLSLNLTFKYMYPYKTNFTYMITHHSMARKSGYGTNLSPHYTLKL